MKDKEPIKPKQHAIFTSSSENSSRVPSAMNTDEEKNEDQEDENDDDDDNQSTTAFTSIYRKSSHRTHRLLLEQDTFAPGLYWSSQARKSIYVGGGNVQAVSAARKRARLNESFPRSDPLRE